jgi:hypothetical protein
MQTDPSPLELLHYCFGHLNYKSVKAIIRKGLITGIKMSKSDLNVEPPVCAEVK